MPRWLQAAWGLVLARLSPADLPYDRNLTLRIALLHIGLTCAFALVFNPPITAAVSAVVSTLGLFMYAQFVLRFGNKEARTLQTVLALLLVSLVFTLAVLPFAPLLQEMALYLQATAPNAPAGSADKATPPSMWILIPALIQGWQFVVMMRIFKSALEVRTPVAVIATILFSLFLSGFAGGIAMLLNLPSGP